MATFFLWGLCLISAGYAVLGRGFAYLGMPPVYVGEVVLALGALALLTDARVRHRLPSWSRLEWLPIYLLCAWGAIRTVPYLSVYGPDALRDGALWGYSAFALIAFATVKAYPVNLRRLTERYDFFAAGFPPLILLLLMMVFAGVALPKLGITGLPVAVLKPGDIGVHLGGVTLFWLLGLSRRRGWPWRMAVVGSFLIVASMSRGAALAFVTPFLVQVLVTRRVERRTRSLLLAGGFAAAALVVLNPRIEVRPGRWLDPQQVVANLASIFSRSGDQPAELEGTRAWRLTWWATIVQYTFGGDRFWMGKGFGVDLAEEDGFVLGGSRPNRYPHSVHMNMLARAGVPGLILWCGVLLVWARTILHSYSKSLRDGHSEWAAFFLFLLGYWAAFVVNASFDVFLEGPMGGIWFWSLMGIGLAAAELYQRLSRSGELGAGPGVSLVPHEAHA